MPVISRHPMPEQPAEVRSGNFKEVALGYDKETAVAEAKRCLNCKKPRCVTGCPVNIYIPEFIHAVAEEKFDEAIRIIKKKSSLPAVCGRVCPQETQCEGKCILGIKGEPVAIGRLERFVADYAREHKLDEADVNVLKNSDEDVEAADMSDNSDVNAEDANKIDELSENAAISADTTDRKSVV